MRKASPFQANRQRSKSSDIDMDQKTIAELMRTSKESVELQKKTQEFLSRDLKVLAEKIEYLEVKHHGTSHMYASKGTPRKILSTSFRDSQAEASLQEEGNAVGSSAEIEDSPFHGISVTKSAAKLHQQTDDLKEAFDPIRVGDLITIESTSNSRKVGNLSGDIANMRVGVQLSEARIF